MAGEISWGGELFGDSFGERWDRNLLIRIWDGYRDVNSVNGPLAIVGGVARFSLVFGSWIGARCQGELTPLLPLP